MFAASNISRIKRHELKRPVAWGVGLSTIGMAVLQAAFAQVSPTSTAHGYALDEVVVTARRVEENVQRIPLSVQVLSKDFLESAAVTRLYELQFNVPGLVVNNIGFQGAGFALRGVADQRGTGNSVATHLDGVYLGTANLAIARMFDLERIEVLKGPQGTLYGRNSTGGSLNFITKPPASEFSAGVEVAHGSFETSRLQGHVNLPLEKGAVRLAFIGSEGEGYIRNSLDDRRFAENDFWGLRAALRLDVSDRLRIDFMGQHVADDGASGELWVPPPQFLADASDIRLATVTLANPYLRTESDNASVNVEYDLGFATLRSITGYARIEVNNVDDCAGVPRLRGCIRGVDPFEYEQRSQEIQFASDGDATVNWVIGANYFDADGFSHFHQFTPALNPLPTRNSFSDTEETASAIFGQATLRFADRWSVTGGMRLSHEEQRVSDFGTGTQDSPTLTAARDDWDGTSWRIDFDFAATDDVLVYAGVSTGFKSGGISTNRLPDGELNRFDPENLTAFEAGVKAQWLDRRVTLNGAAFFYDAKDMQITSTYVTDSRVINEIDNAARAELYGIDTAGNFQVSDRLTLSGGAVWMPKREFVEYRNARDGDTLSGNKVSRAPEWTATAAIDYALPLRDLGRLSARIEYNYRSKFFFSQENDPLLAEDGFGLLNVFLRFESARSTWYAFASGRNLTDEDYFNQILLQASPGYPDTYEVGFGYRF